MMTNNNNVLAFTIIGGRIITWNPTVSALSLELNNIYVLVFTLLFKGIMELETQCVHNLLKLISLSRNLMTILNQYILVLYMHIQIYLSICYKSYFLES